MPKKYWIALFLLLLAAVAAGFWIIKSQASFPSNIKSQANFPIYFPAPSSGVDPSSIKITTRGSDKVLTFILKKGSNQVTFTEQAAPSILTDQTAVDKLAGLMHVYKELNTSIGKVELTRPQELKGTQTALADPNFTTLIFAKPDHNLSDDEWPPIFNSLEIVK